MSERLVLATFDGIVIPHINNITEGGGVLADIERTAGGLERMDMARTWRVWSVQTAPMPDDVANHLRLHLRSIGWGYGDWWCWLMDGTQSTRARIPRESFQMTPPLGANNRRALTFEVVER